MAFKPISKGCEYVLRALTEAASKDSTRRFQASEICEKADIPEAYTRKVLQALVQGGFLRAVRGPGGGYVLTRSPKDISLLGVIKAVDGEFSFDQCLMGRSDCSWMDACPIHDLWTNAKEHMLQQLESTSLHDLWQIPVKRPKAKRRKSLPTTKRVKKVASSR